MHSSGTVTRLASSAILLLSLSFATACKDNLGPSDWVAYPDTVDIFSLSRPDYQGLPSAYDMVNRQRVAVEALGVTGSWDFALLEEGGALKLMPSGAIKGLDSSAGIAPLAGKAFDDVTTLPSDTALYKRTSAVALESGVVYAVRSRRYYPYSGAACSMFAKLEPVTIDAAKGELRFRIVRNPNCNDRSMVPPKK
jgi:hypothetical protein